MNGFDQLSCPPRFGTPRNFDRATLGEQAAQVAERLGLPLMPWQRYVLDVALEIDPATGLLWYGEVVLTVPRQSGKTTTWLAVCTHRALAWPTPQNIVYTAQTRGKARQKWADEHLPILRKSVFADRMGKPRLANDSEHLPWNNGSRYGIEAGTETAGHGSTYDLGGIDEAFAPESERREQAIRPAMITRPEAQLWVMSSAGIAASLYLKEKVDAGRKRVESGRDTRVAYFDWSAPDDADPDDEAVWWACMPALGHTVTIEAVRTVRESMSDAGFRRAYLNQWGTDVSKADQVIGAAAWLAAQDIESRVDVDMPRTMAVYVSPFRESSSIAVGGIRSDGLRHGQVVETEAGADWVVPRVLEMREQRRIGGPILLWGAASSFKTELADLGIDAHVMTLTEMRTACAMIVDDTPELVRHIDQPELNVAVANAIRRGSADAWVWDKRGDVNIGPLVSFTAANWGMSQGYADKYDVLSTIY